MDLGQYVDDVRRHLAIAAEAGGEEARALAERLVAPLDAAIRLALQSALAAAADEITCELAPGSVELRVRGRDLAFVVTPPPADGATADHDEALAAPRVAVAEPEDGGMARINVRMPEHLKARIEQAAGEQRLSVNAWLVRAADSALERLDAASDSERRTTQSAQRYRGWAK
jgi:HicB family